MEGRFRCKCGTRYCGKACQRAHWPEHKSVCKELVEEAKIKCELDRGLRHVIEVWVESKYSSFAHYTAEEAIKAGYYQDVADGKLPKVLLSKAGVMAFIWPDMLEKMVSKRERESNTIKCKEWTLHIDGIPPKTIFSILVNVHGNRIDGILKFYAPEHAEPGYAAFHFFDYEKAIANMGRLMDVT